MEHLSQLNLEGLKLLCKYSTDVNNDAEKNQALLAHFSRNKVASNLRRIILLVSLLSGPVIKGMFLDKDDCKTARQMVKVLYQYGSHKSDGSILIVRKDAVQLVKQQKEP